MKFETGVLLKLEISSFVDRIGCYTGSDHKTFHEVYGHSEFLVSNTLFFYKSFTKFYTDIFI